MQWLQWIQHNMQIAEDAPLLAGGGPLVNTHKHRQLHAQNFFLLMDHSTSQQRR